MLADKCEELGLNLPDLSKSTQEKLMHILPDYSKITNPLDITGGLSEEIFNRCLEIYGCDENLDVIVVATSTIGPKRSEERAMRICDTFQRLRKPLVSLWLGGSLVEAGVEITRETRIPCFRSYEMGLKSVKALIQYSKALQDSVKY